MFQQLTIVGNLGKDPVLRDMPSGDKVCNFSVAVNETYTDRSGNRQGGVTWFEVSVFGRQAEPCGRYLAKGRQVLVVGKVKADTWVTRQGESVAQLKMRAATVQFLGGKEESSSGGGWQSQNGQGSDWSNPKPTASAGWDKAPAQSPPDDQKQAEDDGQDVPF